MIIKDKQNRIQIIVDCWDTYTLKEIGKMINVSASRLGFIVNTLRKNGILIPKKTQSNGELFKKIRRARTNRLRP